MERNSIGAFIAALRKSQGMTQQELADRLCVSNKTVSKWECDGGLPELSLIPVLAEVFGVTSDEILRGERISINAGGGSKTDGGSAKIEKTDRQIDRLISNTMSKYRMAVYISAALAVFGLVIANVILRMVFAPMDILFVVLTLLCLSNLIIICLRYNSSKEALDEAALCCNAEFFDSRTKRITKAARKLDDGLFFIIISDLLLFIISFCAIEFTFDQGLLIIPPLLIFVALCTHVYLMYQRNKSELETGSDIIKKLKKLSTICLAILGVCFFAGYIALEHSYIFNWWNFYINVNFSIREAVEYYWHYVIGPVALIVEIVFFCILRKIIKGLPKNTLQNA